jgi:Type I restriction modification DNA specificity domain
MFLFYSSFSDSLIPFLRSSMSSVHSVLLSDVLHSYRVGINLPRLLNPQGAIDPAPSSSDSAEPPTPLHQAFVLKNLDLRDDLNALALQAIDSKPVSLKRLPKFDKHLLKPGDVLATLRFVVFWVSYLQPLPMSLPLPLYAYNNLAVLRPNPDLILPDYLTLCLRSHSAQAQILRLATQVTQAGKKLGVNFSAITLAQLVSISIPLPSLLEQQSLVDEFLDIVAHQVAFEQTISKRHSALQQRLLKLDDQLPPSDSLGVAQVGYYNLYRNRLEHFRGDRS